MSKVVEWHRDLMFDPDHPERHAGLRFGFVVRAADFLLKREGCPWWCSQLRSWGYGLPTVCVVDFDYGYASDKQRKSNFHAARYRGGVGLFKYSISEQETPEYETVDSFKTVAEAVSAAWWLIDQHEVLPATFREEPVVEVLRWGANPHLSRESDARVAFTWSADERPVKRADAPLVAPSNVSDDGGSRDEPRGDVYRQCREFLERFSDKVTEEEVIEMVNSVRAAVLDVKARM